MLATACPDLLPGPVPQPSGPPRAPVSHDSPPLSRPLSPDSRDARGRFLPGNPGGPGNPFARRTAQLRRALCERVTEEDIQALADQLLERSRQGDLVAMKLLFAYVLGRPAAVVDPDTFDATEGHLALHDAAAARAGVVPVAQTEKAPEPAQALAHDPAPDSGSEGAMPSEADPVPHATPDPEPGPDQAPRRQEYARQEADAGSAPVAPARVPSTTQGPGDRLAVPVCPGGRVHRQATEANGPDQPAEAAGGPGAAGHLGTSVAKEPERINRDQLGYLYFLRSLGLPTSERMRDEGSACR